jgi:two-component system chemotaxis sensor kinase CheA
MNPLLEQFLTEARDFLQGIGEKLMALEARPDDAELMVDLFRLVHTLKGNSGLFEFPDMTRLLHAGEDLMDAVRDGRLAYSQDLADQLLDAMDLVGAMLDEIEAGGTLSAAFAEPAQTKAAALRRLKPVPVALGGSAEDAADAAPPPERPPAVPLADLPETARLAAFTAAPPTTPLWRVRYFPDAECFFHGEDPFFQARNTPGLAWGRAEHPAAWPPLAELDCYRCELAFDLLVRGERMEIVEYFRYMPDSVDIEPLPLLALVVPQGHPIDGPVYGDFVAEAMGLLDGADLEGLSASVETLLELSAPELWLCSALRWLRALIETAPEQTRAMRRLIESLNTLTPPEWTAEDWTGAAPQAEEPAAPPGPAPAAPAAVSEEERALINAVLAVQAEILALPDGVAWLCGRIEACAATVRAALARLGEASDELDEARAAALEARSARPLAAWLAAWRDGASPAPQEAQQDAPPAEPAAAPSPAPSVPQAAASAPAAVAPAPTFADRRAATPAASAADEPKFGRRAEDAQAGKVLKVDQAKVDRLMNLIGEMVVAKNGLPYLAKRAEDEFGVRELAREIKTQYAVINRIAEEMQDAIMQVRMMPVSLIFRRFPRLVRDISRKLGKEVELLLEGEDTEADKNIVESLADPLIHIVRNSLDHGIETPEVRTAAGKPAAGRLTIRAWQDSDRVSIEISDDGRGIDPAVIKHKAYAKGLIDEGQLERISDAEAQNLIFAAGFSTAETVTDLSGRGVGMDVVRSAIDNVGGTVQLSSTRGKGTTLKLSLPLSMAVTHVMIVESDRQIFGVPMDQVVETVRLPRAEVRALKHQKAAVLRDRVVPLNALNDLLGIQAEPRPNADDELAVLVVRIGNEPIGLIVDDFNEVVDVILKPLPGELGKLACYAGTALLGDGSVLMVLNPKELLQ